MNNLYLIEMDFTGKCETEGCLYKKDTNPLNNKGLYCCRCCQMGKNRHGRVCQKKYILEKLIYCKATGGFNDIMTQLICATEYAIKYKYSIIFTPLFYSASNFADIFDFTVYPCKIYINNEAKELLQKLNEMGFKINTNGSASSFNETYPPELILFRSGMVNGLRSGNNFPIKPVWFFKYIKLTDTFKQLLLHKLEGLPKLYYAIHIRNTDHWTKCKLDQVQRYLLKINDKPVVLATDNKTTLETLCDKFSNIIPTGALDNILSNSYNSLHRTFRKDPDNLQNAILDIIVIANAFEIKTTLNFGGYSGFSELIYDLHCDKNILATLISEEAKGETTRMDISNSPS
jgi:hypothetical protein